MVFCVCTDDGKSSVYSNRYSLVSMDINRITSIRKQHGKQRQQKCLCTFPLMLSPPVSYTIPLPTHAMVCVAPSGV